MTKITGIFPLPAKVQLLQSTIMSVVESVDMFWMYKTASRLDILQTYFWKLILYEFL